MPEGIAGVLPGLARRTTVPHLITRQALQNAADSTRRAAHAAGDAQADCGHPAVQHLTAAADLLAAGRDLLRTHFTTNDDGPRREFATGRR